MKHAGRKWGHENGQCFTCKELVQLAREKILQELPQKMRFACLNEGCSTVFTYGEIQHHMETCVHNPDNIPEERLREVNNRQRRIEEERLWRDREALLNREVIDLVDEDPVPNNVSNEIIIINLVHDQPRENNNQDNYVSIVQRFPSLYQNRRDFL